MRYRCDIATGLSQFSFVQFDMAVIFLLNLGEWHVAIVGNLPVCYWFHKGARLVLLLQGGFF